MSARWGFRVEPAIDRPVREAAATSHQTLTAFVVGAADLAAERVFAERTSFVLEGDQWKRFVELLNRPPRDTPGLEKVNSRNGSSSVSIQADAYFTCPTGVPYLNLHFHEWMQLKYGPGGYVAILNQS